MSEKNRMLVLFIINLNLASVHAVMSIWVDIFFTITFLINGAASVFCLSEYLKIVRKEPKVVVHPGGNLITVDGQSFAMRGGP